MALTGRSFTRRTCQLSRKEKLFEYKDVMFAKMKYSYTLKIRVRIVHTLLAINLHIERIRGGSRICEKGGRESKFLDAAPENNKNRPKKQKSAKKRGGPRPIRPPPLDPPLKDDWYFIH